MIHVAKEGGNSRVTRIVDSDTSMTTAPKEKHRSKRVEASIAREE